MTVFRVLAGALGALAVCGAPLVSSPDALQAQRRAGVDSLQRRTPVRAAAGATQAPAADTAPAGPSLAGLAWRSIGPATMSGRISDIAIHPKAPRTWYLAAASGGVWKTTNAGTTFTPVFDGQASYSIGTVVIDPANPHTVWVGTGENNYQRAVAYGDGVYKSVDDGATWTNMGLKTSEHIGRIVIDPTNSDIVYVAAQGPAWSSGGERGLYKTTDGGRTWTRILGGGEWVGVNDVQMDVDRFAEALRHALVNIESCEDVSMLTDFKL